MTRIAYLTVLVAGLLVLAAGGWAVKGVAKLTASAKPKPSPETNPQLAPST